MITEWKKATSVEGGEGGEHLPIMTSFIRFPRHYFIIYLFGMQLEIMNSNNVTFIGFRWISPLRNLILLEMSTQLILKV